uniref:MFS domain-containing protein n=1 Tax=Ascaris lumbricoides TaxID=6252 RepID=A0A0M3I346_ASCLU
LQRGFDEQLLTTIFSHATLGNSIVAIISGVVAQYAADLFGFMFRGFDEQLLTTIFSHATLGNSIVAIISGVVAQYAADLFGFITPFQVALAVLMVMTVVLLFTWPENYGDQKSTISQHFIDAIHSMKNDGKVICLCLIQSLFEGAMYVFVLEWTPALTHASNGESIPHGYIFASFMVAIMMGSSIFKMLSKYYRPESFMSTPFQVALAVLMVMTVVLLFTWPENYGDQKSTISQHFVDAIHSMKNDGKVICLCLIQSLFEGAMYVFVLEWTPALTHASNGESIPHGYIFASFMVAIMMGSSIFKMLSKYYRPESFMRIVLLISSFCLAIPIIFADNESIIFGAFIIFEICVGIFWPAMGFMRGIYIPEQTRSTIMNFCRIPLNAIVITILLQDLSMRIIFQFCVLFLAMATLTQQYLYRRITSLNVNATPGGNISSLGEEHSTGTSPAPCPINGSITNEEPQAYAPPVERILRKREGSLPNIQHESESGAPRVTSNENPSSTETATTIPNSSTAQ